jgi:hypothetical protein
MQQATTRELAYRANDGVEVSLFWSPSDNRLTVSVCDTRIGDGFAITAHPENALDVFYHPYAYAASQGIDYVTVPLASAEPLAA